MSRKRLSSAFAVAATGITAAGLALTALPANAATTAPHPDSHPAGKPAVAPAPHRGGTVPLSAARLAQVRARQRQLMARYQTAPTFAKAGSKTFTVNTTQDSALANPAGTSCVDAADGKCSLRAAVGAANNLHGPAKIVLGKHTYTLTLATTLDVTNSNGVSIVGRGAGKTAVNGDGSGLFQVTSTGSGVPSGQLFLTSLKLEHGTAANGGAVYLANYSSATLVLDHVVATDNTASTYGGAIDTVDYSGVFITDSTFTHNHAVGGGAVFSEYSDVKVINSTFDDNSTLGGTAGEGGAFYNDDGVLDITGGSISGNTAGDATHYGEGGAIYDDGSQTSLTKVHLDHNTVTDDGYGGAVYAVEDALQVTHGTMSHNRAEGEGSGGAVYVEYGSQEGLHGVTLAGNRTGSDGSGGAIYVYSDFYPSALVIDSGSEITGSNNSAVYLYAYYGGIDATIDSSTLAHNTDAASNGMNAEGCGGAVCAFDYEYGAINLEMQGDHVTSNGSSAAYGTGGVEAYGYEYGGVSMQLRHTVFTKNHSGGSGYGGAVGMYSDDDYAPITARMSSNRFIANSAGTQSSPGYGGALFLYQYVLANDHGSTFSQNHAIGDGGTGGAVYDEGYESSVYSRTTFTGNTAGTNHTGNSGWGGAYYSYDDQGGNTFTQVTMSGNKAATEGGGFFGGSDNYETTFESSTISGNVAGTSSSAGRGGGIVADDAVLTVENSTLTGNRALSHGSTKGQGGAIWHSGSRLDLRYSTISGNDARRGGGILTHGEGGSLAGSIVSRNRTAPHGAENDCAASAAVSRPNSLGGNVLGGGSCVLALEKSDKVSRKPDLGKLKNNGGPTRTMAISAQSPAVGRASFQVPGTDQRGHGRPGSHADAGAFELPRPKHHHY